MFVKSNVSRFGRVMSDGVIEPENLLPLKSISFSSTKLERLAAGRAPSSSLSWRCKICIEVRLTKLAGIPPSKEFPPAMKMVKLTRFP